MISLSDFGKAQIVEKEKIETIFLLMIFFFLRRVLCYVVSYIY